VEIRGEGLPYTKGAAQALSVACSASAFCRNPVMARASIDNSAYYINRELSWLQFNRRVLEEAQDDSNPLLERLKFLSISASNLDEFFEVRVAGLVQQIEDGYSEAGPDGLTLTEERDSISDEVHKFVAEQYQCWNEQLRPQLSEKGIRVLGLYELDENARAFVEEYCDRELDLLLTPAPDRPFSLLDMSNVRLLVTERLKREAAVVVESDVSPEFRARIAGDLVTVY